MDAAGIVVLILSTAVALLIVPDVHLADLVEPTVQAALGTPLVLTAIVLGRFAGWRPRVERRLLALFLALMPAVYLLSLALHGDVHGWWSVELAGQLLFAAVAVAGLRVSGWFLALGIVAHGLAWDLPHVGRTQFMPDWYAWACMAVDVGWGCYAATRVAAWEEDARAVAGARVLVAAPQPTR